MNCEPKAGFWGPCDSNVRFCEEKYAVTPYVAEFWNTVSNLGYVLLGLYGLLLHPEAGWSLSHVFTKLGFTVLFVIGVGSMLLHGTLQKYGEYADEAPMILLGLMYELAMVRILVPREKKLTFGLWCAFFVTISVAVFGVYVKTNNFDIFLQLFSVQIGWVLALPMFIVYTPVGRLVAPHVLAGWSGEISKFGRAVFHIAFSRIIWEIEQQSTNSVAMFDWHGAADPVLCAKMRFLSWCHVWFHFQSAYSAYLAILVFDRLMHLAPWKKSAKKAASQASGRTASAVVATKDKAKSRGKDAASSSPSPSQSSRGRQSKVETHAAAEEPKNLKRAASRSKSATRGKTPKKKAQ